MAIETRSLPLDVAESDGLSFRGHAAAFGVPAWVGPPDKGFQEQIERGAFTRSLASGADVVMLVDHQRAQVLARRSNGSLRLAEDDKGLAVEADLAETSYAKDLAVLLRSGLVGAMSFGFSVPQGGERWERRSGGLFRTLTDLDLVEVSTTSIPVYSGTSASLRAMERHHNASRDLLHLRLQLHGRLQ